MRLRCAICDEPAAWVGALWGVPDDPGEEFHQEQTWVERMISADEAGTDTEEAP